MFYINFMSYNKFYPPKVITALLREAFELNQPILFGNYSKRGEGASEGKSESYAKPVRMLQELVNHIPNNTN